jgi:apolipoprotein N-acyltransferase
MSSNLQKKHLLCKYSKKIMDNQQKPLYIPLLLSISSAVLLWLGWVAGGFFLFVAFLPLFEIEVLYRTSQVRNGKWHFWGFTFLGLWLGNLLLFSWLFAASVLATLMLTFLNALLMLIPFMLFRITKNSIDDAYGYFSFVLYWLALEYLQLHSPLATSALVLGNAFATLPNWVQWYEFTGVLGGSLWILSINILLYLAIRSYYPINQRIFSIYALVTFFIGFLASWMISSQYKQPSEQVNVAFIQPASEESKALPNLAIPAQTDLLILPDMPEVEGKLPTAKAYLQAKTYLEKQEAKREALFVVGDSTQSYLQSRFLLGVEVTPLPLVFDRPPFSIWDNPHSWQSQINQTAFTLKDSLKVAPVLGYEAFSGDYLGNFIDNKANILIFFPQDSWGFSGILSKMYFQYACLRAIEQRRAIVVASNKGVSGFISSEGEVIMKSNYQLPEAHQESLAVERIDTVYSQQGDYLGRLAWFLAVALFLTGVVKRKTGGKSVIKAGLK